MRGKMNDLFKYFERESKRESERESKLPSPSGPLSKKVLPAMIQAANDVVKGMERNDRTKRGPHVKLLSKDKARIGNYALTHGKSAAIGIFELNFPV